MFQHVWPYPRWPTQHLGCADKSRTDTTQCNPTCLPFVSAGLTLYWEGTPGECTDFFYWLADCLFERKTSRVHRLVFNIPIGTSGFVWKDWLMLYETHIYFKLLLLTLLESAYLLNEKAQRIWGTFWQFYDN